MPDNTTPIMTDAIPGYDEYEINVENILRAELPAFFERIAIAPLTEENVMMIPEKAKGAYLLFENGHPVYAGKTDTRHGFRDRLDRHRHTVMFRRNLDPARIGFKAVRVMVFSNFDVEAILIQEMRQRDSSMLLWNTSGFGSNDPGHGRERQAPSDFDTEHPIDIDRPLDFINPGQSTVLDVLINLKNNLPFTFRYETDEKEKRGKGGKPLYVKFQVGHVEQRETSIVVPDDTTITARLLLDLIVRALPNDSWRATIFPDRVILYRDQTTYPYALESIPE